MHELSQGLRVSYPLPSIPPNCVMSSQDIRKNIPEISSRDELPGDRFHDVMIVSYKMRTVFYIPNT